MPVTFLFAAVKAAIERGFLRSFAGALRRIGAGLPLFNWIKTKWGITKPPEASQAYGVGQQYVHAGNVMQSLPSGVPLSPSAPPHLPPGQYGVPPGTVARYGVSVEFTDPSTGRTQWTSSYIASSQWLTLDQLANQAVSALAPRAADTLQGGAGADPTNPPIAGQLVVIGVERYI